MPFRQGQRRPQRLTDYDYSWPGSYFLTICAYRRQCLFGNVVDEKFEENGYGKIISRCWLDLPSHYGNIELDAFVVMPNHIHGIITLVGAGFKPAPTDRPLTEIVRGFKTHSSKKINELRRSPGIPVWQRGFYDHVIRNEASWQRIREYIITNPLSWHLDRENRRAMDQDEFDRWLAGFK